MAMNTKELAIRTLEELPEDATWEDVQERINFLAGIRKGLRELDAGKGIPHGCVRDEFAQWLCLLKERLILKHVSAIIAPW